MNPNSNQYNIATIRSLIRSAFTAGDLRRFCQDRPIFRPILNHFGPKFSLEDMIDTLLEQCEKQALFPDLLTAIREHNPQQYERYSGQLALTDSRRRVVNLRPLDMTHAFRDRQQEIQALHDYLSNDRVRLIGVVGQGGMGKTALVSYVLADLEPGNKAPETETFDDLQIDGILYLSAKSTGLSLERLYSGVEQMLDEATTHRLANRWTQGEPSPVAKAEYLLEALQDGLYLILLDNLEDVLMQEGEIAEEGLRLFVERCLLQPSGVRLIVTSRQEIRLPPAALSCVRTIPLEGLPEEDAIALLRDLDPQGQLGLQHAPIDGLRDSSQRTQGVPLALELLAGLLAEDPTLRFDDLLIDDDLFGEEVVNRLLIESYQRLGDGEHQVLQALAVFDHPVARDAVSFLLQPWFPDLDIRAALRRLARRFIVTVHRASGEYSLHPLNQEYAYRKLPDDEEPDAYNRRNLELRAAEYYAGKRKPESEWQTIDDLTPQLAEFKHRIHAEDYDSACRSLHQIGYYLYLWGHYALAVDLRENLLGRLIDPGLEVANLGHLANAYRHLGQIEQAILLFQQAIALARETDNIQAQSLWLGRLGIAFSALGDVAQAIPLYEQALTLARQITDRRNQGECLSNLAVAYHSLGQVEQARVLLKKGVSIAHELGDQRRIGSRTGHLGLAYQSLGHVEQAASCYQQALSIAREVNDRRNEVIWLNNLGHIHYAHGKVNQAMDHYKRALATAREIHDVRGESYQLLGLAKALLVCGDLSGAAQHCTQALDLNVSETGYVTAVVLGITLLHQDDSHAKEIFSDAAARSQSLLNQTANLYKPRYMLATALVGQAACDPRWVERGKHTELLAPALAEYQRALETCAAKGVIRDAIHDLELIRRAGIEGLDPVFELLTAALKN